MGRVVIHGNEGMSQQLTTLERTWPERYEGLASSAGHGDIAAGVFESACAVVLDLTRCRFIGTGMLAMISAPLKHAVGALHVEQSIAKTSAEGAVFGVKIRVTLAPGPATTSSPESPSFPAPRGWSKPHQTPNQVQIRKKEGLSVAAKTVDPFLKGTTDSRVVPTASF